MELWEKDLFNNRNIFYLFNKDIVEYDMKEAGFSLTREHKLLSEEKIQNLLSYPKEERHIRLGYEQRENHVFKDALKNAFIEARKSFITENELDENDIISIKKDALFVTRKCSHQSFGDYVLFREKNHYTSYIRLSAQVEFFYNENQIDVKGIRPEKLADHEPFMLKFIKQYFYKMETEPPVKVIDFLRRFITKYKERRLEAGYYQKFSRESGYDLIANEDSEQQGTFISPYSTNVEGIDITYNFYEVLIKLIKIPL